MYLVRWNAWNLIAALLVTKLSYDYARFTEAHRKENEMDEKRYGVSVGLSILGGFLVGIFGLFAAFLSLVNEYDYIGVGVCLLASAFAFGLLTNAFLRK
jgi:hypothetical protein